MLLPMKKEDETMNKSKWRELVLYVLAIVTAKVEFAGCYPLIPAFFVAGYMEEVNRTLLLVFSIFGMAHQGKCVNILRYYKLLQ